MIKYLFPFFFIFLNFLTHHLIANEHVQNLSEKTICLNMIVKNESHVIAKCLESVKGIIDYWVIVDTGSDDGTQALIQKCLEGIPGELHERPWKDFAYNRNQALKLAKDKADYLLFIDADEELEFTEPFDKQSLKEDGYLLKICQEATGVDYQRMLLVNNQIDWKWEGVLHENLIGPSHVVILKKKGIIAHSYTNGYRSKDPDKYLKDAKVLEKALEEDPGNSRYVFYLAQSYINVPDYSKALKYYKMRATMGGWEEEVFFAKYCVAMIQDFLGYLPEECIKTYSEAYALRPTRVEPLYRIAEQYMRSGNFMLALIVINYGLPIPISNDSVFVESWIYEWGLRLQAIECLRQIGRFNQACAQIQSILKVKNLPEATRDQLTQNLKLLEEATSTLKNAS